MNGNNNTKKGREGACKAFVFVHYICKIGAFVFVHYICKIGAFVFVHYICKIGAFVFVHYICKICGVVATHASRILNCLVSQVHNMAYICGQK